jgi:hypothetical protein
VPVPPEPVSRDGSHGARTGQLGGSNGQLGGSDGQLGGSNGQLAARAADMVWGPVAWVSRVADPEPAEPVSRAVHTMRRR